MRIDRAQFFHQTSLTLINKGFFSKLGDGEKELLFNEVNQYIRNCSSIMNLEEMNDLYRIVNEYVISTLSLIKGKNIRLLAIPDMSNKMIDFSDDEIRYDEKMSQEEIYFRIYNKFSSEEILSDDKTRKLMRNFLGDRL